MMQIRNELAMMRWRSGGDWSCPVVIRVPIGGYLQGGAVYHSQSRRVALHPHARDCASSCRRTPLDANGLLRTAIRCDDPVLFLEHKHLYRQPYAKGAYPGPDYMIPFGKARLRARGHRPHGGHLRRAGASARRGRRTVARGGRSIEVEVLDLRSLAPWDWEAIAASVRKTGRVLVVHEDTLSFGFGAEIAARIADELFEYLDAPVRRVAARDTSSPTRPILEDGHPAPDRGRAPGDRGDSRPTDRAPPRGGAAARPTAPSRRR